MPQTIHVFKYTKEYEHYSDLYDQGTISTCKMFIEGVKFEDLEKQVIKKDDGTEMTREEKIKDFNRVMSVHLNVTKGERCLKKEATVKEWMDRDKELDERLEKARVKTTYCNDCGQTMECSSKSFHGIDYKRVLIMYDCPDCKNVRAFFDNDEEYIPENKCTKCYGRNESKSERDEKRILITDTCMVCGYVDTHEYSLAKEEPENKEKVERERRQFLADRENYCYSEKEAEQYVAFKEGMERINEMFEKDKEKEKNKELYDELAKIQKINVAQLNKLLSEGLAKENYVNLQLGNPEIGRDVILGFTIQENDANRKEYNSEHKLKKLIDELLYNTNWKLMSDGVSSRLGVLSGRLRGFESENDLLELTKKRFEKK